MYLQCFAGFYKWIKAILQTGKPLPVARKVINGKG